MVYNKICKYLDLKTHCLFVPMDNWENIEPANRYYLMRWYAMRNVNTGFCFILIVVKILLCIF